jgi:hypothetical protein
VDFKLTKFLQEAGWPNVTPDKVRDQVNAYWIARAQDVVEIDENPALQKARNRAKTAKERKEGNKTKGKPLRNIPRRGENAQ